MGSKILTTVQYKMKTILIVCLVAFVVADDKYDSSHDNIDLSEVLGNDRLLISYSNCMLDKGPCTPEVKQLKDKLPEALETRCAKCTDKQKSAGKQLVKELREKHPDLWKKLVAKYDPAGKHREAFEEFLKN